ncbi:MAG: hypothetical protein JRH11_17970 [Deltaproteobacteria bacterium]|nr:hypothetical protein [Deltaproteobacteria bacterium]
MSGRRMHAVWLALATAAAVYLCVLESPAYGQPSRPQLRVALGTIGSPALRTALEEELATLGGVRLANESRARYIVTGSFTRLERRRVGTTSLEVDCEVSLILADARGGAVRMMLSGRAGARGGTTGDAVERAAVEAAVRGALRPLPRTLRRMR